MPPELITGLTITGLLVLLSLFWPRRRRPPGWQSYALGVLAVALLVFMLLRYQGMISEALDLAP